MKTDYFTLEYQYVIKSLFQLFWEWILKHKNLFSLFVVICILVLFVGCSDFFGGNVTTDLKFKINLEDFQVNSRSATRANEVAKISVELISQDKSVSLKQEQNIIDNTTDYFTFKNIKVGTTIKITATISQEDKELYVGETEWLNVKPNSNLISLVLEKNILSRIKSYSNF